MWNRAIESLPREHLDSVQLQGLRATVTRVLSANTPLGQRLRHAGLTSAEEIASLDHVRHLPFTMKADLRDNYPFGLFAVPLHEVVRLHASSGTRGKPTVVGYTRNDLAVWAEVMARCLVMAGVEPGMVVHNAYGYGLFTGGLGIHQGAELLGCLVVPISGGLSDRQALLLRDFGGQVLCATPSYALRIAEALDAAGIDPRTLKLRIGIFGAEPWSEELRGELERRLHLQALDIYGLSEIIGPGVAAECAEGRAGFHIHEDHFLPEIIDPETGDVLPLGEEGELVFTTLSKEALPLIRYRTGDISSLDVAPCACGRTLNRMSKIRGRHDDMLIIRGVNLYPSEIERVLLAAGGVSPHYQIVVDRPGALDELTVLCEPASADQDRGDLQARLSRVLYEATGLSILIDVLEQNSVPRSEGKAVRVIDRRTQARVAAQA